MAAAANSGMTASRFLQGCFFDSLNFMFFDRYRCLSASEEVFKEFVMSALQEADARLGFILSDEGFGPILSRHAEALSDTEYTIFYENVRNQVVLLLNHYFEFDVLNSDASSPFSGSIKIHFDGLLEKLSRFARHTASGFDRDYINDAAAYFVLNCFSFHVKDSASVERLRDVLTDIAPFCSEVFQSQIIHELKFRLSTTEFKNKYWRDPYHSLCNDIKNVLPARVLRDKLLAYRDVAYPGYIRLLALYDANEVKKNALKKQITTETEKGADIYSLNVALLALYEESVRLATAVNAERDKYKGDQLFQIFFGSASLSLVNFNTLVLPLDFWKRVTVDFDTEFERIFSNYEIEASYDVASGEWHLLDLTAPIVADDAEEADFSPTASAFRRPANDLDGQLPSAGAGRR